jgi:hypothetical protein
MSAFIGPSDAITAEQLAKVKAWLEQYGRAQVPVLVGRPPDPADFEDGEEVYDDREVEFTHGGPYLSGQPGETARRAVLRLGRSWRTVALDSVEVHPRHVEVAGLAKLDDYQPIDFPPPDCAFCDISLTHDGDGWYCEQCGASWDSSGQTCTRKCVEPDCDGAEAEVIGEDQQPRCKPCAFEILIGALEPTPPYCCHSCRSDVVGMPYDAKARRSGHHPLCGRCKSREDSDAYWKNYLDRPATATATVKDGLL